MNWDDVRKFLLALTMWREAQGEGRTGMRAVGHVIRNRVLAGKLDYLNAIEARNQFSSISIRGDGETIDWPKQDGSAKAVAFETAMQLVPAILDGSDEDLTGGATFYRNPVTATSKWFDQAVATGKLEKIVSIGHHDFYKEA
jgi:N-acetylmuramoyl-L-alanine amidase